ncbi:hypothetical protein [Methanobrevibacter sp.]|uniref:hypothetical protein n=1 Tax=Methanobrevibacter sp. TaxID=66852 RepID=UPI0038659027
MDNKKIIFIVVLLLIIVGIILVMLANSVDYERIEITPNGTSMDVPANQTKYQGNADGLKIWNWENGLLVTYNSHDDIGIELSGLGFNAINELIKTGELQNIDGFTCYVLNADELLEVHLFDIIKVNYNGKYYFIPLSNETTHDNIIICCEDKDIAVHMAKSVEYKNVYPNSSYLDINTTIVEDYLNQSDLDDVKSSMENYLNQTDFDDARSSIENITGNLLSKVQ